MKNLTDWFDRAYVISCQHRPDRLAGTMDHLASAGLVDPPDISGQRRVVNLRFECYRSPYGNKPQVYGEAVELDPPT